MSSTGEKKEYVNSESPALDELLGGGLKRGTTCLLEELGGEDRGISGFLGISFIQRGLRQGEPAILLLTEHTVEEYRELLKGLEIDLHKYSDKLIYMDALSSLCLGESVKETTLPDVVRLTNVRYTAKFYEEFRRTVRELDQPRIYVDSLSVLVNAMESEQTAWQFWLSLLPLIRHRRLTVISSFYPEMHSPRFVQSIERISDTIIRFTSSPPRPNRKPVRYICIAKHRGVAYDERMLAYTSSGVKFFIARKHRLTDKIDSKAY